MNEQQPHKQMHTQANKHKSRSSLLTEIRWKLSVKKYFCKRHEETAELPSFPRTSERLTALKVDDRTT